MPSVGMRRSTRVLGARVLRSGRRLTTEPREGIKHTRAANGENKWAHVLDNSADEREDNNAGNRLKKVRREIETENKKNGVPVDIVVEPEIEERVPEGSVEVKHEDKIFGKVYRRKRKRGELVSFSGLTEDQRFGKKFVRKQWRRKCRSMEICRESRVSVSGSRVLAIVVNESSYDCGYWVAAFLTTVLSYMSRVRIGIRRLSAFVLSRSMFSAYSSRGVLFIQDSTSIKKPGFCVISGCRSSVPIFSVDFSAIPFSFLFMHTTISLCSVYSSCLLVAHSTDVDEKDEIMTDLIMEEYEEPYFQIPSEREISLPPQNSPSREISHSSPGRRDFSHSAIGIPKSSLRTIQLRSSRNIQKRRSSLRRKKGRPPVGFRAPKASGALASADIFKIRHDNSRPQFSSSGCSANLLIIETDKCYRVEGATITLELSSSKQWVLAIKKNGITRCSLSAQGFMRPSCSNRFTHATVWIGDPGWKLEFLNKQDWLIFKELYKECSDRNVQAPNADASVIPVPGVQEVESSPFDGYHVPYVRPDSYITVKYDELTRALVKKSANYDMDSEDEEWLAKFNDELLGEEVIEPESFELIIDAFEKGSHSNQEENFDEQVGCDSCEHLERREVVDAIRNYWVKKRKQKRSALVRIFQLYQPRRPQVIPKSVLRKKRSFKRQASNGGRGKQRTFLQAMSVQRNSLQQQNNERKVQEAKSAADRSERLAILKRQRAQMLMENADLATYKAMMALRIAEAAQIVETPDKVSSFVIG